MGTKKTKSAYHALTEKAATALGHITIAWGRLEAALEELLQELARLDERHVAESITGNLDIRSKIQALKGLAFVRGVDMGWRTAAISLLDHVDNTLRVKRNDVIHAKWFTPKGTLVRITKKTKLLRPQAFQLTLETEQYTSTKVSYLRELHEHILSADYDFMFIIWYIVREKPTGTLLERPPKLSFQRYLRQVGYGSFLKHVHLKRALPRLTTLAKAPRKGARGTRPLLGSSK